MLMIIKNYNGKIPFTILLNILNLTKVQDVYK